VHQTDRPEKEFAGIAGQILGKAVKTVSVVRFIADENALLR